MEEIRHFYQYLTKLGFNFTSDALNTFNRAAIIASF